MSSASKGPENVNNAALTCRNEARTELHKGGFWQTVQEAKLTSSVQRGVPDCAVSA